MITTRVPKVVRVGRRAGRPGAEWAPVTPLRRPPPEPRSPASLKRPHPPWSSGEHLRPGERDCTSPRRRRPTGRTVDSGVGERRRSPREHPDGRGHRDRAARPPAAPRRTRRGNGRGPVRPGAACLHRRRPGPAAGPARPLRAPGRGLSRTRGELVELGDPAPRRGLSGGTVQATVGPSPQGVVAEVAWVVGAPWQGRGIATEAARGLVEWLGRQPVREVRAHIHPEHHASAAVAAAAGLAPSHVWQDGELRWLRQVGPETDGARTNSGSSRALRCRVPGGRMVVTASRRPSGPVRPTRPSRCQGDGAGRQVDLRDLVINMPPATRANRHTQAPVMTLLRMAPVPALRATTHGETISQAPRSRTTKFRSVGPLRDHGHAQAQDREGDADDQVAEGQGGLGGREVDRPAGDRCVYAGEDHEFLDRRDTSGFHHPGVAVPHFRYIGVPRDITGAV